MSGFVKHDSEKEVYALIPPEFEEALAKVLTFGASHPPGRTDDNWKKCPTPFRTYYSALRRHLAAFARGERSDLDSGQSHLAHAACCLVFLSWFEQQGRLEAQAPRSPDPTPAREVLSGARVGGALAPRYDGSGVIPY